MPDGPYRAPGLPVTVFISCVSVIFSAEVLFFDDLLCLEEHPIWRYRIATLVAHHVQDNEHAGGQRRCSVQSKRSRMNEAGHLDCTPRICACLDRGWCVGQDDSAETGRRRGLQMTGLTNITA